jgi:ADP-ribose pyrophosphatase YjhB (NUDIX family)
MHCELCGRACIIEGEPPVPVCPMHGERWKLARNAPASDVIIVRDDRVLLARRAIEPEVGLWELPGGFANRGEHPAETARREIREELGVSVRLTCVLGFYIKARADDVVHVTVYLGETDDEPREADGEVAGWQWFAADELPAAEEMAIGHRLRLDDWLRTRRGDRSEGLGLDPE